jgi:DnaJ-class molecular chaperone
VPAAAGSACCSCEQPKQIRFTLNQLENTADLYSVLGIKPGANELEVKQAYRKMVFRYHPDRNPGDADAAQKFNEVLKAYGTLSDLQKRAAYNAGMHQKVEEDVVQEKAEETHFGEGLGNGFNYSHDFKTNKGTNLEPQPKCPQCGVTGTDCIMSRKGGTSTSRGKQFILSPFSVVFCSECGHVYGIMSSR